MAKIRVGIIGTNFVADFFMKGISMVPGYEIAAACANTQASVDKFADKYDVPIRTTDYRDLAQNDQIDMAYIATPNHLHHEMTLFFLKNKISVFCEKPLAANARQVEEMIQTSRENKTLLFDGIVPLYTDNFKKLDGYLAKIAPLQRAVFTFGRYSSRYDAYLRGENPPTFRNEFANGSLMDMGVYCVSVAVGLFGKPKHIQARSSKLPNGTDCLGTAIFTYDNFEAVIMHSKVCNTGITSEVQGESGIIFIEGISRIQNVYIQESGKERKQLAKTSRDGFYYQLKEFKKVYKAGGIESEMTPHKLSQDIADVMFEMRRQSGIHFPCYGE